MRALPAQDHRADAFYENVDRDGSNVVLEFRPRPAQEMLVACLWSRWSAPGTQRWSDSWAVEGRFALMSGVEGSWVDQVFRGVEEPQALRDKT
jgi:hypothetical protein